MFHAYFFVFDYALDLGRVWIRGKPFERVILVLATRINIENKIKSSFLSFSPLPEMKTSRWQIRGNLKSSDDFSFFFFLKQNLTESYSRVLAFLRLENPCHRPLVVKKNINRVVKK